MSEAVAKPSAPESATVSSTRTSAFERLFSNTPRPFQTGPYTHPVPRIVKSDVPPLYTPVRSPSATKTNPPTPSPDTRSTIRLPAAPPPKRAATAPEKASRPHRFHQKKDEKSTEPLASSTQFARSVPLPECSNDQAGTKNSAKMAASFPGPRKSSKSNKRTPTPPSTSTVNRLINELDYEDGVLDGKYFGQRITPLHQMDAADGVMDGKYFGYPMSCFPALETRPSTQNSSRPQTSSSNGPQTNSGGQTPDVKTLNGVTQVKTSRSDRYHQVQTTRMVVSNHVERQAIKTTTRRPWTSESPRRRNPADMTEGTGKDSRRPQPAGIAADGLIPRPPITGDQVGRKRPGTANPSITSSVGHRHTRSSRQVGGAGVGELFIQDFAQTAPASIRVSRSAVTSTTTGPRRESPSPRRLNDGRTPTSSTPTSRDAAARPARRPPSAPSPGRGSSTPSSSKVRTAQTPDLNATPIPLSSELGIREIRQFLLEAEACPADHIARLIDAEIRQRCIAAIQIWDGPPPAQLEVLDNKQLLEVAETSWVAHSTRLMLSKFGVANAFVMVATELRSALVREIRANLDRVPHNLDSLSDKALLELAKKTLETSIRKFITLLTRMGLDPASLVGFSLSLFREKLLVILNERWSSTMETTEYVRLTQFNNHELLERVSKLVDAEALRAAQSKAQPPASPSVSVLVVEVREALLSLERLESGTRKELQDSMWNAYQTMIMQHYEAFDLVDRVRNKETSTLKRKYCFHPTESFGGENSDRYAWGERCPFLRPEDCPFRHSGLLHGHEYHANLQSSMASPNKSTNKSVAKSENAEVETSTAFVSSSRPMWVSRLSDELGVPQGFVDALKRLH